MNKKIEKIDKIEEIKRMVEENNRMLKEIVERFFSDNYKVE